MHAKWELVYASLLTTQIEDTNLRVLKNHKNLSLSTFSVDIELKIVVVVVYLAHHDSVSTSGTVCFYSIYSLKYIENN